MIRRSPDLCQILSCLSEMSGSLRANAVEPYDGIHRGADLMCSYLERNTVFALFASSAAASASLSICSAPAFCAYSASTFVKHAPDVGTILSPRSSGWRTLAKRTIRRIPCRGGRPYNGRRSHDPSSAFTNGVWLSEFQELPAVLLCNILIGIGRNRFQIGKFLSGL